MTHIKTKPIQKANTRNDMPNGTYMTRTKLGIALNISVFSSALGSSQESHIRRTYFCDERTILLHLMVVVMATGQELPHLAPEGFWDAAAYERRELLGPHRQIQVPEGGTEMKQEQGYTTRHYTIYSTRVLYVCLFVCLFVRC